MKYQDWRLEIGTKIRITITFFIFRKTILGHLIGYNSKIFRGSAPDPVGGLTAPPKPPAV